MQEFHRKSFSDSNHPCFIFVHTDEYKEIFSTADQLGTLEFLCIVCADQPGLVLVLPAQLVHVVFQLIKPDNNIWWF